MNLCGKQLLDLRCPNDLKFIPILRILLNDLKQKLMVVYVAAGVKLFLLRAFGYCASLMIYFLT